MTVWTPDWKLTVGGVDYTDIAISDIQHQAGRDNIYIQPNPSYVQINLVALNGQTLSFIKNRKIDIAVNKPKTLWVSLTDKVHKNRIVFPFYNTEKNAKIMFYQSRALYKEDEEIAKYLSKSNSDKYIFNLDKVSPDIDYVFLQEGQV